MKRSNVWLGVSPAGWLNPTLPSLIFFVLQNLTLIFHAHRRQVVLSTTWSFAKVFVFVQRKFLSSGCSPPSLFWLARALLSSFLSFKILYIYAMKKGIELRSSVTHSHAWKMCATLKNCISSFLTLQQSLWALLLLPTENASFFSESITVTFYAPLPVPKRLSFSTLCCTLVVHEAHFFQDLLLLLLGTGPKKEFLTEENCNLNARWRLYSNQT